MWKRFGEADVYGEIRIDRRVSAGGACGYSPASLSVLPSAHTAMGIAEVIQKVGGDASSRAGLRVLLVEDHVANQELVCAILSRDSYRVDIANDGIQAIDAVKANVYDLILMDILMPRMDGVTAARKIREMPGSAGHTPIIALTAHAAPDKVRAYWQAGMDDFVAKPFKKQDLHDAICRVVGLPAVEREPARIRASGGQVERQGT